MKTVFLALLPSLAPVASEPALTGLDPVALCEGEETPGLAELTATHGRHAYRFATAGNRERFLADPGRWGIQWGGGCGRMGPLSGRGDPDRWAVSGGRIFVFASDACREGFLSAPERFTETVPGVDADPAAIEEGRALLERVLAAHGGAEAVDAARAVRFGATGESGGWTSESELLATARGHVRRVSRWTPPEEGGAPIETAWVVAADAFTVEDGELFDLVSPEERADTRRYAHRQLLPLLWARDRHDFVPISTGLGLLDGRVTADLEVLSQGLRTMLHLDTETFRVLGISWRGRVIDGAVREVLEVFTRFETVDGVVAPVGRKVLVDGDEQASFEWTTTELLAAVPEDELRRPDDADGR